MRVSARFLVYLSIWKGLEVAKNHEKYEVFACQGHDPRDSCRIMSFLVVLPDGFWAVAGFSQTKSRLLAFPGQKPEIQESIAKSTILVLLWGSPHFGGLGSGKSKKYKGPWKWPPEKERLLQNRQFWCFCGRGSPHFGGLGYVVLAGRCPLSFAD